MSELNNYIKPELIIEDLKVQTKEQAIAQLVDRIFQASSGNTLGKLTSREVYAEVMKRENIQTTGMGNGLAFPHGRLEQCSDLIVAIGVSKEGIDFKSLDGQPCNIICLMLSPAQKPYIILKTMAALARFFAKRENISRILSGMSNEQIADTIKFFELTTTKTITAQEVMRPVAHTVTLDITLEQATYIMHLNQIDVLPVINANGVLCGEISCLKIFTYGIPDFFNQLETVSFVKNLDPFEKYFKFRKDLKVSDIYDSAANTIRMDTTLMEIIFEMTVKNKPTLFVIDNGKLVGEVNRFTIIDKILFF
jgi:mannitol/fructose-specific phosphotransferase system IIA component (Ntr-type)